VRSICLPTAAYYTLGCKVNQYETEKIRQEMESHGFDTVAFAGVADVYVINTCTVTAVADGKSRHAIRQAIKRNQEALVVATGCYTELESETVAAIDGVDMVVANEHKDEIAPRAASRFPGLTPRALISAPRTRTRAILKVQDGCDQFCAYCAVPYARSGKRSRLMEDILREARTLAEFGYKEIVLTGIRLGSYDDAQADVAELANQISIIHGIARVRLSSIEAWEISDRLIQTIANNPRICPHLHVPLQSGDNETLQTMGRPYDTAKFSEIIDKCRQSIPDLGVTTDILVGFPGETDESFERTMAFVENMRFSRLHVFRYSPRPHTRAAEMREQVPQAAKEQRSVRMIELGNRMAEQFARQYVGQDISALLEHRRSANGKLTGHTANYIEVELDAPGRYAGEIVTFRASGVSGSKLTGRVTDE
jgi:threonylcarbamoyladenosine tRNA methylthiotransferase MtaB